MSVEDTYIRRYTYRRARRCCEDTDIHMTTYIHKYMCT